FSMSLHFLRKWQLPTATRASPATYRVPGSRNVYKQASDLRKGDIIESKGDFPSDFDPIHLDQLFGSALYCDTSIHRTGTGKRLEVLKANHVTGAQRAAYMQMEFKDLLRGAKFKDRFRVDEKIERMWKIFKVNEGSQRES